MQTRTLLPTSLSSSSDERVSTAGAGWAAVRSARGGGGGGSAAERVERRCQVKGAGQLTSHRNEAGQVESSRVAYTELTALDVGSN